MSVYKPKNNINVSRLFKNVQKEKEFIELIITLVKNDRLVNEIQKDKKEYFHDSRSEKEVIARKLTMVAGLSEGFVAGKRL